MKFALLPKGELPLPVLRLVSSMRCNGGKVDLEGAGPGFTRPPDMYPAGVIELNLERCNLIGVITLDDTLRFYSTMG